MVIDLEGHGREELWEDVDLSRTVGWFTTTFPVLLEAPSSLDPGASLRSIKERLRAVPKKGIGFGLLRYVGGFPRPKGLSVREHAARLAALPHPQVIFNYLGQLDAAAAQTGYVAAAEPSGMPISPRGKRSHLIDVVAVVENGQLRVEWMHDRRVHPEERIRELSDAFLTSLRRLVAHCCSADAAGVTPSDFPLVPGLSQEALDGLVAAAGGARRVEDLYPLSPLQQGILFHSLYDDPYLQQLICRLGPDLDVGAFTRAWQSMVERHPILRTSFVWEGFASPLQVVHESATIPIERHDWRHRAAFAADLAALLREDRARGLDLGKAPAMRLTLIDAPQGYRLIWTFHHILCDGWSSPLLFQELFASYDAYRAGSAPPEHPARPPYRDYIAWLGSRETAASERFWRSRLSDFTEPTLLPVPSGGARGDGPAELTAELPRELSRELSRELAALARSQQLTTNTVLLAAFALVLAAYTGRRDVVFGATVSGRSAPIPGIETMIGLFINTLPVRVRLDPLAKVNDFLAALQADQAEGREHEHTPLVDVHGLSGVPRGQPLFECLFVFENYPASSVAEGSAGSLSIDDVAATDQTNYPLTLSASPGEPLPLRAVYDTRRFSREWMARLLDHLGRAVEAIVHGGERRLGELSLLSDSERRTLLTDFAGRRAPRRPGETVHALIAAQAARTPEATALVAGEERLSYAELDGRSNRIARRLLALGVRPETRIGVFMRRSPSLIVVLLGILKSGAAYVPLDPTYPSDRITFMLSDARAPFVIHDDALSLEAPPGTTALPFSSLERTARPDPLPSSRASDDSLVYVIYTSGSSGRPKGVENRHAGLVNLIQWFVRQYEIGPRDRFAPQAAVGFDAFALETWPALAAGAELHLLDDDVRMGSPEALLTWLAERQITLIHLPPVLTEPLLDAAHPQGLALRALLTGSDTVQRPPRRCLPFQFANHYGPTECSILATRARVDMDLSGGRPAIGRPLDNVRVYLLDEGLALSPLGGVGELFIGGVGVGRGYAFDPALTAERFLPDPFSPEPGGRMYRTGDLARWSKGGQLDFLGRKDHQIKLRGFRIELGEVESALLDHPSVKGAACFIAGKGAEGRRLIACVVPEGPFREDEVRGALRARLPDFMLPSAILPLEALPLTPNGKLDRRALVERASDLLADREEARAIVPPRDDVERGLLECWEELFERRPLSVTDDFFELGGHSLLAVRLLAAIRRRFDYAPSLAEILTRRTVRALAETLRPAPRSRSVLVPLQPRGARPPLYCLHPAGGTVLAYDALARTLGPDQPFFAFEAPGLHGEREPFRRIDELARHLTDVLLAERPDTTPFRLAGYSMGGLVALEMGRELRARGREVALVALIDSYLPPEGAVPESDFHLMQTLIGLLDPSGTKFRPPESILHEGTVRERIARIFALAKEAGVAPDVSLDDAELLFRVSAASSAAFCSYRPSPYPGPLVLFRTDGDDDERDGDFGALAQRGLTVVRLDGVHADKHNELLSPAHVGALAAPLGDLLRSLDSSSERRGM